MEQDRSYDCIVVGGGLAGLSLSILLARQQFRVLLLEKKSYPYHKVCGEYISMESWGFLQGLGIPVSEMGLPLIKCLLMTGIQGQTIRQDLDLGGFGISRYQLDDWLAGEATAAGVVLMDKTTCLGYVREGDEFRIKSSAGDFRSRVLCGSFGRHATGNFFRPSRGPQNWVGVKYHVRVPWPEDQIALHTFRDGYCGISRVEDGRCCLCYLVKADRLQSYGNRIERLEQEELAKNPFLAKLFQQAEFLFEKPVTVSNITFAAKEPVWDGVFYLGDSAGAIAPLTGNGMSNALRSASLLSGLLPDFLNGKCTREHMEEKYRKSWNKHFSRRLWMGRMIQYFFCQPFLTGFFIALMKQSRRLREGIIRQTHGLPF